MTEGYASQSSGEDEREMIVGVGFPQEEGFALLNMLNQIAFASVVVDPG